jgi:Short C-terminal domain
VTVGKISGACWAFFVVMSVAFLPLGYAIWSIHALPSTARAVLAVAVVLVLWWGPFAYAMYLSLAVMRNGDRRLLKRGIHGTAEVLSAKATRTVIQEGEFAWEAPRLYKYRLRVSIPGKAPYETDCAICAAGIREGMTVHVAVSPHNRHRVTIDVGQATKGGDMRPHQVAGAGTMTQDLPASAVRFATTMNPALPGQSARSEAERLSMLTQLSQLHRQGDLTDAEFAQQKAQILGE